MKHQRRIYTFLLGSLLLASQVLATPMTPATPPRQVEVGGFFAFKYWFAKKVVLDVDKLLKEFNLNAEMCTFRQASPLKDFSYRGAGPCLFKALSVSMKDDRMVGSTWIWIRGEDKQLHPVEVQWRPPHGGWGSLIKQAFDMRFEKRSAKKAQLPFKQFIGGDIKILFPADSPLIATMVPKAPAALRPVLSKVESVSLHLEPTSRQAGHVVYKGNILIDEVTTKNEQGQQTTVQLRTDVNVVVLKRPFFVEARIRRNSSPDAIPAFPNGLVP